MKLTRDEHMRAEGAMNALDLVEPRIRELEAERDALKEQVARLTAVPTSEEIPCGARIFLKWFQDILAARMEKPVL